MTGRSVPEWIGKTPDTKIPTRVRMRVFLAHEGVCHISKRKIMVGETWEVEHVKPLHLAQPGENLNRESNLAPALQQPHREKTAREMTAKAKADRTRAKHLGIHKSKSGQKIPARKDPWGYAARSGR